MSREFMYLAVWVGVYGCSPCGRSDMFTGGERGIISKGDGVVVICSGDSRIAREMFTFSERGIRKVGGLLLSKIPILRKGD